MSASTRASWCAGAPQIGRIEKLTGLSLRDQRDRTLALLAVTWESIAGDVPPIPADAAG